MPRLKQRRQNIQYGGTKVSIRESIEAQFRPSFNNDEISLALLENCTSIDLINSNSYGSYIFTGTIPKDDSLVMIESQVEKKKYTLNPNMSFENAKHTSYNVGIGKQSTKFVMKVIFCDYDNISKYHSILCDSSQKEVSSKEAAKSEFDIQQRVYAESICISGETGTVIPDAISYTIIDQEDFKRLFSEKCPQKYLIDEIIQVLESKKLKLFIIFIDFLDGFTTFGSLIRTLDISLHRTISYKISSIMLYILFNSKILNGDLHEYNIMCKITKRPIFADIVDIKLIDLGKTFDITKALTIFQDYIDRKEFKLQKLMCIFFRIEYSEDLVNIREILVQQFKLKYDELLGDLDNLKNKFIEGTKIYKREIIFKMLVFICFIDAMGMDHKHYGQIQFKYVMMYVFNCNEICFTSLHNFLLLFSFDYSIYLQNINNDYSEEKLKSISSVTTEKFNNMCDMGLDVICDNLVKMLSVCKRWKGATPLLLRGNDQIEEARFLISTDSKDTSRWENFINRGGSARKRKYRSRRLSKHIKSIKHRRYHYRHFTKRNLIKKT